MSETTQIAVFTAKDGDVSLITFERGGFPVWEIGYFYADGRDTLIQQFSAAGDAYEAVVKLVGYNATAETADGGLSLVTVSRGRKVWREAGHSAIDSGTPAFAATFRRANPGHTKFTMDFGALYKERLSRMFGGK